MVKDPIAACKKYAEDNSDAEGIALTVTVDHDIDERLEHSDRTWEDGIPVTKLFERNDAVNVFVPAGSTLRGVSYVGRTSGQRLFEFIWGSSWYRTYQVDDAATEIFGCKTTAI